MIRGHMFFMLFIFSALTLSSCSESTPEHEDALVEDGIETTDTTGDTTYDVQPDVVPDVFPDYPYDVPHDSPYDILGGFDYTCFDCQSVCNGSSGDTLVACLGYCDYCQGSSDCFMWMENRYDGMAAHEDWVPIDCDNV